MRLPAIVNIPSVTFISAAVRRMLLVACALFAALSGSQLSAQSPPANAMPTPADQAQGSPASSYALSGIDNVNYYNGNLNIQIPLYTMGGRGDLAQTMSAGVEQRWTINEAGAGTSFFSFDASDAGYAYGFVSVGFTSTLTSCGSDGTAYSYLIWTKSDLTQVYLVDTAYNGEPEPVTAIVDGDTCDVSGANRGTTFRSYDGSNVTFTVTSGDVIDGETTSVTGTLTLPNGTQYQVGTASYCQDAVFSST